MSWHVNTESWGGLQLDSNDATAHYYSTWTAVCNYDSNTYPWSI